MTLKPGNNHLINETSPYLLQHAHNPVDWYPWGEEALSLARSQDKPILLSIGYSACHWCHVMAHESFENIEIAHLMNDNFINIKVDREERPDLDAVYMEAVQSLTGSGGWPLTVFLTPETKPFYGGTYFPPEDRSGMPGFPRVLKAIIEAYQYHRDQIEKTIEQITTALNKDGGYRGEQQVLNGDALTQAYHSLKLDYDAINGGFGGAPKFPHPLVLEYLLRYHYRTRDEDVLEMVNLTLEKMARGGIYDQIGGGFHRYSTDDHWLVPHFEKMLYDNALLSQVYLHAYLVTRKPLFRRISEETIDYILREMTGPGGVFYSSQDADSEGIEGKYYTWTSEEIEGSLGAETGRKFSKIYAVAPGGNFEGRNILHLFEPFQAAEPEITQKEKNSLLKKREERVHPGRDEKVLASWNGLMLGSLAEAARVLHRDDYLAAARANSSFLLQSLISGGYLQHIYHPGKASIEGYLEDYALVIAGLLEVHLATFSGELLRQAIRLAATMIELFWNDTEGAFYDTSVRHQALFFRPKSIQDGASPSGASAATLVLLKISRMTGNERMWQIARRSLQSIQTLILRYPLGLGNWLCALDFFLSDSKEIVLVGPPDNLATQELLRVLFNSWLPGTVMVAHDPQDLSLIPGIKLLEHKNLVNNLPSVYLCENYSCRAPVTDPDSLRHLLHQGSDQKALNSE